jgi:hypothetical protein
MYEKDRATQEWRDTGVVIFEDGRVEGEDQELVGAYKELLWINIKRGNSWPQIIRNFTDGYRKAEEIRERGTGAAPG